MINSRILGIDHGNSTGWALLENGKYIDGGIINLEGETQGEKSLFLLDVASRLIIRTQPTCVALERPMDKTNGNTTECLIGLYNTLLMACTKNKARVVKVYPSSMKKVVVGNGKATKDQVALAMSMHLDMPLEELAIPVYYKKAQYMKAYNLINGVKTESEADRTKKIRKYIYDKADASALAYYAYKEENE